MLKVKLLEEEAKAPTVAHAGEDLAYDLYALTDQASLPVPSTRQPSTKMPEPSS